MQKERLVQFECQNRRGGCETIFYYQTGVALPHFIRKCPSCGSLKIQKTGREYSAIKEFKKIHDEVA